MQASAQSSDGLWSTVYSLQPTAYHPSVPPPFFIPIRQVTNGNIRQRRETDVPPTDGNSHPLTEEESRTGRSKKMMKDALIRS
jgi:hypothetical protein